MEDWPEAFATYFGINETAGQLILSIIVIFAILLPTMILARGKNAPTIWLIMTFLGECVVLALNWLPFWIMIMTIVVTALALSLNLSGAIVGG